jgi:hypothetical protein
VTFLAPDMSKIVPHRARTDHDVSVWLSRRLAPRLTRVPRFGRLLRDALADVDVLVLAHPERACVYEEAWAYLKTKGCPRRAIYRQVAEYTRAGYPPNLGLADTRLIVRRHTSSVARFNELWWQEIMRHRTSEQLSFDYAAWKSGVRVRYLQTW